MYHTIEFANEIMVDIEISPKHPLERMCIRKGTRVKAQVRPYVLEAQQGPVEVADLFFADGTVTRQVPFSRFVFVDD